MVVNDGRRLSPEEWLGAAGNTRWRRVFRGRANQIEAARKFSVCLLAGTGCEDDAEWITAELATNAVVHTRSGEWRGWFGVEVRLGACARVAVYDLGGWDVPTISPEQADRELTDSGRGLLGVSRLAVAMGISGNPAQGHTVWADLAVRGQPAVRAS